jgi:hypothetical protein
MVMYRQREKPKESYMEKSWLRWKAAGSDMATGLYWGTGQSTILVVSTGQFAEENDGVSLALTGPVRPPSFHSYVQITHKPTLYP